MRKTRRGGKKSRTPFPRDPGDRRDVVTLRISPLYAKVVRAALIRAMADKELLFPDGVSLGAAKHMLLLLTDAFGHNLIPGEEMTVELVEPDDGLEQTA